MKLEKIKFEKELGWDKQLPTYMDSENTLIILFGSRENFDYVYPVEDLIRNFPTARIVGCSTSGIINNAVVYDSYLTAAIIKFEQTEIRTVSASIEVEDESYVAGEAIAEALNADDLQGVIVFSDGLMVNGSELVEGLRWVLKDKPVMTGGLAGDGNLFEKTWVVHNGLPQQYQIAAVGFYGSHIRLNFATQNGLDVFGIERKVTRAIKNRLYELDGVPALELYKNYLGELAADLPGSALRFPLSLRADDDSEHCIVRTILNVSEADQSMIFAGDIPEGSFVQLMRANFERVIDGAAFAGEQIRSMVGDNPVLCLAISCVGRRMMLGERTEEEVESVFERLPKGSEQIGFYSYGEFSPSARGRYDLHNQTMTLTTIHEE
ncbi:MAG: FIST signal transduction protein [Pyrinomonadaceae bacterium]